MKTATIYCEERNSTEVYKSNREKSIQTIMKEKVCDRIEAIRFLNNSTIDNPVVCDDCMFWIE